jgi:MFS family permease
VSEVELTAEDDRRPQALAILGFSLSLGTATLVLPLLALSAGYDAATIGLLTAVSAISQIGFRLLLPWVLARYPDREVIGLACLIMAASYGLLFASIALPFFVAAELMQGGSRALFWTSSQTHAVRGHGGSVRSLARMQVVGNVGNMIGPPLAGLAAGMSLEIAMAIGILTGIAGAMFSRSMHRLPAFVRERRRDEPWIWRRSGVDLACWAGFASGGLRAMQGSYIPILLEGWGIVPSVIGLLLGLADAASTATAGLLVRFTPRNSRTAIELGVIGVALGLAALPLAAGQVLLAALLILVAGAGAGILTTVGPALASDSVRPNERGDALAWVGTFRGASLFATPTGVALGLSVVSLPVGIAVAGALLALPAVATGIASRWPIAARGAA